MNTAGCLYNSSVCRGGRGSVLLLVLVLAIVLQHCCGGGASEHVWASRSCTTAKSIGSAFVSTQRHTMRPERVLLRWHPSRVCSLTKIANSSNRRCFSKLDAVSSGTFASSSSFSSNTQLRKAILRQNLEAIGMDADGIEQAVLQSMEDSSAGYDGRFGRSAIRTCQSFYYPKKEKVQDDAQLKAAAARTARQVQFLWKRHQSHEAEWVRHHDTTPDSGSKGKRFPLILMLDNLRSAYNVGSLFRTADAAGCSEVVTVGITPHPFGSGADKLRKSALGAELTVPSKHFATVTAAFEYLHDEKGYQLVGMETTESSVVYTDFSYDANKGVVLILGNEVTGVDTMVMPKLDGIVQIPMFGTKNSLNVAACAPIVLYEIIRQWNSASSNTS
jgi:23S rRNA (guanosine2251-2'-O)-methyltransferase